MEINKQKFSAWLGVAIFSFHILVTLAIFIVYQDARENLVVDKIVAPITLVYSITVLKWLLDSGGLITRNDTIGLPLAIPVVTLALVMGALLIWDPIYYLVSGGSHTMTVENLNNLYTYIESAYGALFALIVSYLYGDKTSGGD